MEKPTKEWLELQLEETRSEFHSKDFGIDIERLEANVLWFKITMLLNDVLIINNKEDTI